MVSADIGLGTVRVGAKGGGGREGFVGRSVGFLHLFWAQVDFDGPLGALQIHLQALLEEEEKPAHGPGHWTLIHRAGCMDGHMWLPPSM
jgi:hypothetical protein